MKSNLANTLEGRNLHKQKICSNSLGLRRHGEEELDLSVQVNNGSASRGGRSRPAPIIATNSYWEPPLLSWLVIPTGQKGRQPAPILGHIDETL
jgi:hypothetical protein